jgi:hypothetical protein
MTKTTGPFCSQEMAHTSWAWFSILPPILGQRSETPLISASNTLLFTDCGLQGLSTLWSSLQQHPCCRSILRAYDRRSLDEFQKRKTTIGPRNLCPPNQPGQFAQEYPKKHSHPRSADQMELIDLGTSAYSILTTVEIWSSKIVIWSWQYCSWYGTRYHLSEDENWQGHDLRSSWGLIDETEMYDGYVRSIAFCVSLCRYLCQSMLMSVSFCAGVSFWPTCGYCWKVVE